MEGIHSLHFKKELEEDYDPNAQRKFEEAVKLTGANFNGIWKIVPHSNRF